MHLFDSDAAAGDHVGLNREVIEVLGFHPRCRFDLGEPPAASQPFEDVDADEDVVKGECRLEDRWYRRIGY